MRGELGNKPESFHGREKALRSLRGPPHFLLRLSGAESPLYELLTHSVSSPAFHAGREATMPIDSAQEAARIITCRGLETTAPRRPALPLWLEPRRRRKPASDFLIPPHPAPPVGGT